MKMDSAQKNLPHQSRPLQVCQHLRLDILLELNCQDHENIFPCHCLPIQRQVFRLKKLPQQRLLRFEDFQSHALVHRQILVQFLFQLEQKAAFHFQNKKSPVIQFFHQVQFQSFHPHRRIHLQQKILHLQKYLQSQEAFCLSVQCRFSKLCFQNRIFQSACKWTLPA